MRRKKGERGNYTSRLCAAKLKCAYTLKKM